MNIFEKDKFIEDKTRSLLHELDAVNEFDREIRKVTKEHLNSVYHTGFHRGTEYAENKINNKSLWSKLFGG